MKLPDSMLCSAELSSNEEAWRIPDFQDILELATTHNLACIGGQFQFRGPIGIAEMYWLAIEPAPRRQNEQWSDYVSRSNSEVKTAFTKLIESTDFDAEANDWKHIREALASRIINDPKDHLYFVAYFNRNPEKAEQGS